MSTSIASTRRLMCGLLGRRRVATTALGREHAVHRYSFESSPAQKRIAMDSFRLHPNFLHDATRRRIADEVASLHAMEVKLGERVIHQRPGRFRRVATSP